MRVAIACKKVLDKHKLTAFIKTSGKTGLHIYIPCSGFGFPETRAIATHLAEEIHPLVKDISTLEELKDHRGDKVYIDAGQNDYADTLAAPYSVRPFHSPTVSTPIGWEELNPKLNPWAFTMNTIEARLKKKGDLFKGVMDKKIIKANTTRLNKYLDSV